MKKIVALLLALVMALSGTLAFAEPAETLGDGLVLTSYVNIDREKVGQLMDARKLDEETRKIIDSALAVVNEATETLTIAENGFEYAVCLKDSEVLRFTVGKTDEGLVVLTNLLNGHALTVTEELVNVMSGLFDISSEIKGSVREEKRFRQRARQQMVTEALIPYISDFIMDVIPAIRLQEEERGEFVLEDGSTYNTRLKVDIDTHLVAEALNAMFARMSRNKVLLLALKAVSFSAEKLANMLVDADNIPDIDVIFYSNLDDRGRELSSDKAFTVSMTPPGQTALFAYFELQQHDDALHALLNIPGSDEASRIYAAIGFDPFDMYANAGGATAEVNYKGNYFGDVFKIEFEEDGDALVAQDTLYILDSEKPAATVYTAILDGAPALDLDIGNRKTVPVESLMIGKKKKDLKKELKMDAMVSGLVIIGKATQAVPEFVNLLALLKNKEADKAA